MTDRDPENIKATQLAGAAVAHFLQGDEDAVKTCLRDIPDPPGRAIGLLRFAAVAVAALAEHEGVPHPEVARHLTIRLAELDD